ncbi:MAG: hypothetical protein U1F11_11315 [Steroidobacteraceae bacterium]
MSLPLQAPVPSWLAGAWESLQRAIASDRLAHALLLQVAPGIGGDWLAARLAARLLCRERDAGTAPCGHCIDCRRVAQGEHPDCSFLHLEEDSREIKIDQVRALAAELALSAHGGGHKIGVISPADQLNRAAANALLKTLEEPTRGTLLVLVDSGRHRLPATVLSRCTRLAARSPDRATAIAWLRQHAAADGDWEAIVDALGPAPFAALAADAPAAAQVAAQTRATLAALQSGGVDPVRTAEAWGKEHHALRLRCIENWITDRVVAWATGSPRAQMRAAPHLSSSREAPNIQALFGLLDAVREARALADAPLNKVLVLERLLWRLAAAGGERGG